MNREKLEKFVCLPLRPLADLSTRLPAYDRECIRYSPKRDEWETGSSNERKAKSREKRRHRGWKMRERRKEAAIFQDRTEVDNGHADGKEADETKAEAMDGFSFGFLTRLPKFRPQIQF